MNKYTLNNTESVKIEKVYKSIPTVLSKENKKFQYKDMFINIRGKESKNNERWRIYIRRSKTIKCWIFEIVLIYFTIHIKCDKILAYLIL